MSTNEETIAPAAFLKMPDRAEVPKSCSASSEQDFNDLYRTYGPLVHGILLARFNSTHDVNYGASTTEPPIEPNLYFIGTMTKRFFDEGSVRTFFQGWDIQFLEENIIHRYEKPKSVWEVMTIYN